MVPAYAGRFPFARPSELILILNCFGQFCHISNLKVEAQYSELVSELSFMTG